MLKKRGGKKSSRGVKYHISHKSRLTSILLIKILLAFVCVGLGLIVFSFLGDLMPTSFSELKKKIYKDIEHCEWELDYNTKALEKAKEILREIEQIEALVKKYKG